MRKSKKKFNKKMAEAEIDITSLLDILVILLVFLLKNYNPSDLKLDLVKDLSLARSNSKELGVKTLILQVDKKNNVFINNEKATNIVSEGNWRGILSSKLAKLSEDSKREIAQIKGGDTSNILGKELLAKKEENLERVNIVLDEELPYETLDKVMQVAATSGYHKFSFIVQSKAN